MTQRKVEKLTPLNEDKVNVLPVADASTTNNDKNDKNDKKEKKKRPGLYAENLPTFYCGIGNNSDMIISILKRLGWDQITEPTNEDFRLKWVQSTRAINWNSFREGEQMVNHIPNCSLFTNKLNLLCTLQAYEKNQIASANKHSHFMPLEDYLPLTYKLDDRVDKETYFATAKNDELWICKPVSLNQGKGIYLVRNPDTLRQKLEAFDDGQQKKFGGHKPIGRIIQKYIDNPLLINKKKFDIRCYMTIANTKPILALFCHGYLRLTMQDFVHDDNNLLTHLTNQFLQKKDERYKVEKDQTTWSMEDFNSYVNEMIAPEKGLPKDWVMNDLTKKMRQIMLQVIHGIRFKMQRKVGYFGIYGYDFMIDENMKVWLIEVNVNPAITTNTEVLSKVIPPVIEEGINISVECFEKCKANKKLLPLSSIKKHIILYNESQVPCKKPRFDRSPSHIKQNNSNTTAPQSNNNNNNVKNQANNQNPNNNNNNKIQVNKASNIQSSSSMSNNNTNNLNVNNNNISSMSNCNIASTSSSNVNRNNNLTSSTNNIAKSAEISTMSKAKNDLTQQRNALSSSLLNKPITKQLPKSPQDFLPRASDVTRLAEIGAKNAKPVAYQFTNNNLNQSPTAGFKTPLKTNVTSLSLKPATVEVYFRSNSGKAQKIDNNRKSVPTTIFPPPKIGLKS